jgi:nucleoside-diphosphate-sugar epimerase
MKKILITGGAGFIGYHVAKRVLDDGHTVVIVDDFSRGIRDKTFEALLEHPRVSLLVLDLAEKE